MQYKRAHTTNTTRVKIVCYYSHRSDGTPYSIYEMQRSMNRKAHDIYEFIYSENKKAIVREDLSIKKAKRHLEKHKEKIISALIFVNDWKTKQECMIGKYHRDYGMQYKDPEFTEADFDGNIYIKKIHSLQRDELRTQILELETIVRTGATESDKDIVAGTQQLIEKYPTQFKQKLS
jgi:hypothetical protein